MFFSASIALTFFISLSGIAVHSAPIVARDFVPLACTGIHGTGTCIPLNVASPNPTGPALNPAACTDVSSIKVKSMILNQDNDCTTHTDTECGADATEHFSSDSLELPDGIKSVRCEADPGFIDGLLAGFEG
ncbi:hypothetical protein DFH09DRAFT_499814 [Mycena vulgaris]|nr:hypothetical protein DFH09DRAFT_1370952 [Mycena vulgaris]KAJ6601744.1 hypothetical protein DFH09DRAFT_499814 [Mycena vulgaris]